MSYEKPTMHPDGSITLPPNPWGTSATWADYDWARIADQLRVEGWAPVVAKVFDPHRCCLHREGDGMTTERTVTDSAALDEIAERYKTWGHVEIFDDASSTIEFIGYVIESTGRKAWFEEPGYLSGEETA